MLEGDVRLDSERGCSSSRYAAKLAKSYRQYGAATLFYSGPAVDDIWVGLYVNVAAFLDAHTCRIKLSFQVGVGLSLQVC